MVDDYVRSQHQVVHRVEGPFPSTYGSKVIPIDRTTKPPEHQVRQNQRLKSDNEYEIAYTRSRSHTLSRGQTNIENGYTCDLIFRNPKFNDDKTGIL